MKNRIGISFLVITMVMTLFGCGQKATNAMETTAETINEETSSTAVTGEDDGNTDIADEKLNVVTTLFPYYDFIRQIAGDNVTVTMIVPAGMDTHSFEPTPADMIKIQKADVFIYNGGDMESWVPQVLEASDHKEQVTDCMMDYVKTVAEETVEGMEPEEEGEEGDEEEVEYDEHIWTSPVNAQKIVAEICNVLSKADPKNADNYQKNTDAYIEQLTGLDKEFKDVVSHSKRQTMIFGDKFPLRYFVEEYGLTYRAAFNGCSTETEPSADTVAYLIDTAKEEKVPVVYYIELSSGKIADTICESTGAKKLLFHSCHNVTKEDFDSGVTYMDLMEQNVINLKEGLN